VAGDRSRPDPMLLKAVLQRCTETHHAGAHIQNPVLEAVTFPSPGPPAPCRPALPVVGPALALDLSFINTVQGSSSGSLQEGSFRPAPNPSWRRCPNRYQHWFLSLTSASGRPSSCPPPFVAGAAGLPKKRCGAPRPW
jgi:hypothetical protein